MLESTRVRLMTLPYGGPPGCQSLKNRVDFVGLPYVRRSKRMQRPSITKFTALLTAILAFAPSVLGSAPSGCTADDSGQVRIMTWNIRFNNPDDGIHAWPERRTEVLTFLRSQNPDILCIQEGLHDQVSDLQAGLEGYEMCGVGRDDGKQAGEYSAIFFRRIRFSSVACGTFWLSPTPSVPGKGWDAALPRIVTWVTLVDLFTGDSMSVLNTHFDHIGVQARENSARLLRLKTSEIAGNAPAVVAGDFNSVDTDLPYRIITDRNLPPPLLEDTFHASASPHHGPLATFTGFDMKNPDPGERIDFLFVTKSLHVKSHSTISAKSARGYLSDHLPVVVEVERP